MSGVMGEMVLLKLNLQGWVIMVKAEGLAAGSIVNCFLYFDFNYVDAENVWCTMWN